MRVSYGKASRKSKKRWFQAAKGNYSGRHRLLRTVKESVVRARAYATRDRRTRKRDFRRLWIVRIGAAARQNGINYGQFMHGLKTAGVDLDRKVLADIALQDPAAFTRLAETAKKAVAS
jgi:large subunit ribosomal protein L20